jgi:hypothetical protein
MKHLLWRSVLTVALTLWLLGTPAGAQQAAEKADPKAGTGKAESGAAIPDVEEKALAVFNKMATFLSQAPKLSVTIESGYDAVQPSGLKVEFGETRKFTIRRPDRMRLDTDTRDGNHRGFRFDGKEIGVFDTKQKVYATAEQTGTTDHAVDYFIDQLQMPLPLSDLFASNLPKFTRNLEALYYVEETTIAGVRCDHLVGSTKNIDFQVWVAQGDKPLLQRLIITYKREEGEPQRWAQFRDWNLSPDVPDSVFAFTPPEGAEKIPFAPRKVAATEAAEITEPKGGTK